MLRFSLFFFLLLLTACGGSGLGTSNGGPTIIELDASPTSIRSGESSTLSWRAAGATSYTVEPGVGSVSGSSVTVNPTQTTIYTLTAMSAEGRSAAEVEVSVTGGGSGSDADAPSGSFGLSGVSSGPFANDRPEGISSADDERVVRVAPGGTFYAQVDYSDPSGISAIELNLVNSNPEGTKGPLEPSQQFFTKGTPQGSCDLSGSATSVTCVYPIRVDEDAVNIGELTSNEFAYVFRTRVTDSAGNQSDEAIRGYVVVDEDATNPRPTPEPAPEPTPEPAPTPDPSENQAAEVEIEADLVGSERGWTLYNLDAKITGFDADTVRYRWRVVEGDKRRVWMENTRAEDTQVAFYGEGEYSLELRVDDGTNEVKEEVDIVVK